MNKVRKFSFGIIICMGLLCLSRAGGEPFGTAFTYQGWLMDNSTAADGVYDLQFTLYDDPNVVVGSQIGSTFDANDVQVMDGYFVTYLDFGSDVFNGDARWLQVAVRPGTSTSNFTALSPLQKLMPAPYALYALNSGGSLWQPSGLDISYILGNVGIGTTSPTAKLEVAGQVKITGGMPGDGKVLTSNSDGLATWQVPSVGSLPWTSLTGVPAGFADNMDNVGLTTESDPTVAANVKDGVSWSEVSGKPTGFADDVDNAGDSDWVISGRNMYSGVSGNIGIGTTSPTAKLEVTGQVKITGGTPGSGKVLTSDSSGLAIWQTPTSTSLSSLGIKSGTVSGVVATAGVGITKSITFTTPYANANYSIHITGQTYQKSGVTAVVHGTYQSKTSTGFTIHLWSGVSSGETISGDWMTVPYNN